jgi:hypothetical protein
MTDFVDYERDRAPIWLQRGQGANLLEAFGLVRDMMAQGARDATAAWSLTAAPDAILATCTDTFLDGPIVETELPFAREVIQRAMDIWAKAGTEAALDVVIPLCGFPTYTITSAPGDPLYWDQVLVEVKAPFAPDVPPFSSWQIGPGITVGPDLVIGFGPLGAYIRRLIRMLRKVKAAHVDITLAYWITFPTDVVIIYLV